MKRREFLKSAGCFIATASIGGVTACGSEDEKHALGDFAFGQGVASGDPQATSVMLWTRVSAANGATAAVNLRLQVSESDDFAELLVEEAVSATLASDHTVRGLVEGLSPDTIYFYRFMAGVDESAVGRTWTAPEADADVPIHFAFVSCQEYESGHYTSYAKMIADDLDKDRAEQLRFLVHLGDFIYETRATPFQQPIDESFQPIDPLMNADGMPRVIGEFPDGGTVGEGDAAEQFALTVADYRHLYKTFLSDRHLQAARARFPFICTWDDHEFSDDCWQTQANYTSDNGLDEFSQRRRVAASQAWSEYIPSALSDAGSVSGVDNRANDFAPVEVNDTAYDGSVDANNQLIDEDNAAAIAAITIYRTLRFGQHMQLVMTDCRSYRSDHALDETVSFGNPLIFHPRNALAIDLVNELDAGRTGNNGSPNDTVQFGFDNNRKDSPPGTMLGTAQKQWWKDVMAASDATWKVWGTSVPLTRLLINAQETGVLPYNGIASPDAWDGYNTERKELMKHLVDNDIRNVVAISGDNHAHYASEIHDDFDATAPVSVMTEVTTAGISSRALFGSFARVAMGLPDDAMYTPIKAIIFYDPGSFGDDAALVPNVNTVLKLGTAAATAAAMTHSFADIMAAANPAVNPHLKMVDTNAYGYALMSVTATETRATLVSVPLPIVDEAPDAEGTAQFTIPLADAGEPAVMSDATFTGKKPFPFNLE